MASRGSLMATASRDMAGGVSNNQYPNTIIDVTISSGI